MRRMRRQSISPRDLVSVDQVFSTLSCRRALPPLPTNTCAHPRTHLRGRPGSRSRRTRKFENLDSWSLRHDGEALVPVARGLLTKVETARRLGRAGEGAQTTQFGSPKPATMKVGFGERAELPRCLLRVPSGRHSRPRLPSTRRVARGRHAWPGLSLQSIHG